MYDRIEHTILFIKSNLDKILDLRTLSDVACASPIHFHRTFKKATGYTPGQYVEICKIKEGLELIKDHNNQIGDIAYHLGFNNYETFSRAFKKHCQVSPGDLQSLLYIIEENTESLAPLVIAGTRKIEDLVYLANEAIENETFTMSQLADLQVCILSPKENRMRSRRVECRYSYKFDTELSLTLRSRLLD